MRIEDLIVANYDSLNETDLIIWRYVINHKKSCSKININNLADACNVSRTTVTRFVKKIGLDSFSEFKVLLGWEANSIQEIDQKAFEKACDSIIYDIENMKNMNLDSKCELVYNARQIYVYGSGDIQNEVAKQMKRMFLSAQEVFFDFGGITFDPSIYEIVQPGDLFILISLSGESKEIVEIAKKLKSKNVKILSITELKYNTVADHSDESLYISATNLPIHGYPDYKITMMYFILIELFFLKYSAYKKARINNQLTDSE